MKKVAAIGVLVSACGGEAFESELFAARVHEDGGTVSESGPIVSPEGSPFHEDAPACTSRTYLRLDGGRAELLGGPVRAPMTISYELRLRGSDPAVRVESSCGWALVANGGELRGTVTGHFDHVAPFRFIDAGWHSIEWRYDGVVSGLYINDALVSSLPKNGSIWQWPSCTGNALVMGGGDVDDVAFDGTVSEFRDFVGAAALKTDCQ